MSGQCQHDVHVSADLDAEIQHWFGEADISAQRYCKAWELAQLVVS